METKQSLGTFICRRRKELGMTQRAVEGRLYRIKNRLRRMLGGEEDG